MEKLQDTTEGLLRVVATIGPDDLPVGLAMRVESPAFYGRLSEIFR